MTWYSEHSCDSSNCGGLNTQRMRHVVSSTRRDAVLTSGATALNGASRETSYGLLQIV